MSYVVTLLLTFVVVALALAIFVWVRMPVYRVEKCNVEKLLELVIAGRATASDWDVFTGIPIRHDPELETVRRRCLDIAEREYRGGEYLFTQQGLLQLERLLDEMKKPDRAE
ncbi:MAG TPA: hypothetical protein VIK82_02405 [Porticoccaceae bacterium]